MPELSADIIIACKREAEAHSVAAEIHPEDFIFWSMHDAMPPAERIDAVRNYFRSGAETAHWIKSIVDALPGVPPSLSFLDFASGYARVARHLPHVSPGGNIVTCDIHSEAVAFNQAIGLPSVVSAAAPESM